MIERLILRNNYYSSKEIDLRDENKVTVHNNPETIAMGFHFKQGNIELNNESNTINHDDLFITAKSGTILISNETTLKHHSCHFIFFRKDKFIALTRRLIEKYGQEKSEEINTDHNIFIYPNYPELRPKIKELCELNKMENSDIKNRLIELNTEEFILQTFRSSIESFYHYLLTATHLSDPLSYTVRLVTDAPQKNWTIKELAGKAGVSESTLYRYFKSNLDTTPNQFLWEMKINLAQKLLREREELNISEIAYNVGMNNPMYFSRAFKNIVGMSPKTYRENYHQEKSNSK